jgi:predicted nucleic acid-binding protein
MLILPDTSAWIPFFTGRPGATPEKLAQLIEVEADVCVCGPTVMEVLQGIRFDAQHQKIANLLSHHQELEIDNETFRSAANIYRTCRAKGVTIRSSMDSLIAATALQYDAYLLHNDRDFAAIAQHFPLKFF